MWEYLLYLSCWCFLQCNIPWPLAPKHEASLSVRTTSTNVHNNDQSRCAESEANTISSGHDCDIEIMDSNYIRCPEPECKEKDATTPFPNGKHTSTKSLESISMREDCPICLEGSSFSKSFKLFLSCFSLYIVNLVVPGILRCLDILHGEQSMMQRTRELIHCVSIISILHAFWNGWREVTTVQCAMRYFSYLLFPL